MWLRGGMYSVYPQNIYFKMLTSHIYVRSTYRSSDVLGSSLHNKLLILWS